jgi:hypothetical protein
MFFWLRFNRPFVRVQTQHNFFPGRRVNSPPVATMSTPPSESEMAYRGQPVASYGSEVVVKTCHFENQVVFLK